MASQKIQQGTRFQNTYIKYVAETTQDVKKIKTAPNELGSEVYVIAEKETYILDSKGIWHPYSEGKDPIECDCVEESTIWEPLPEPQS